MDLITTATSFAREVGLQCSVNFQARLQTHARALELNAASVSQDGRALGRAWRLFLNQDGRSGSREEIEWVCLLGALYDLTEERTPELESAFTDFGLNLTRSRLEMALRLGSRLFMIGRKATLARETGNDAKRTLFASLWFFDWAAQFEDRLSESALARLFGMRGVACLLLKRAGEALDRLPQAARDLARSRSFGNRTAENLEYRRECAVSLYEHQEDPEVLADLGRMLKEEGPRDLQFLADLGRFHEFSGRRTAESAQESQPHFAAGVDACTEAIEACPGVGEPDHYFYNLRGFLYLQMAAGREGDQEQALLDLNEAISDLRHAAEAGFGGASLTIALLRRANMEKATAIDTALKDLDEAKESLRLAEPTVAARIERQIRASRIDCVLRQSLAGDVFCPDLRLCRELLDLEEESERYFLTLAHSLRACWAVLDAQPEDELVALTRHLIERIRSLVDDDEDVNEHHAVLLGYAASLSRQLDRGQPSRRTLALFRDAIGRQERPAAMLLTQAGDTALRAAKNASSLGFEEDVEGLLEESVEWYEAGLAVAEAQPDMMTEGFRPVVCHSKAGEAYLRLHSGSGGGQHLLERSIHHFKAARALGNETPELCGLMADAHYRIGYFAGDRVQLETALDLKLQARAAGHENRENFSVVARIYHRLWEMHGDESLLAGALESSLTAYDKGAGWPWPLFQMAELAHLGSEVRSNIAGLMSESLRERDVVQWAVEGKGDQLLAEAVHCAVNSEEFRRRVLGGRSRVFILDDPHRLLSKTLVIKPCKTDPSAAQLEIETIAKFSQHLSELGLAERFALPRPIAIVRSRGPYFTGQYFYALERASADGLNRRILGEDRQGYQGLDAIRNALEFLATFHAWTRRPSHSRVRSKLKSTFGSYVTPLGALPEAANRLADGFSSLLPDLPMARKCDAHPENWLVQRGGRTIMIDLEASATEPALLDVVRLLDDYPVLRADPAGWSDRMALCREYWERAYGTAPDMNMVETGYAALAVFRCAFGLQYCARKVGDQPSSSSLKALKLRRRHYEDLLDYIADSAAEPGARRLAGAVCALMGGQAEQTGARYVDRHRAPLPAGC